MSSQFNLAPANKPGYDINQVDAFVALARQQYQAMDANLLTSSRVRGVEFDLVHGGYEIKAVDKAVERLEDAFVAREIKRERETLGTSALDARVVQLRSLITARLNRPAGRKFAKASWPLRGYNRKQVDALCGAIQTSIESESPFDIAQARNAIFKSSRGGYVEGQVDAFIDRSVELLQIKANR